MPKKTKKGGGKGGGKTEEERLLHQQQRAQAEEEMAKKKEEILTLFLKDKLQKEERNTTVNLLKLNDTWRSRLRQSRAAELRRDAAVMSQTFERRWDGLDSSMKKVDDDIEEAERRSSQVWRSHLQRQEALLAHHDTQQRILQQQWDDALQHLNATFNAERQQMLFDFEQQRGHLQDAMFTLEQRHKATMEAIDLVYNDSITSFLSDHKKEPEKVGKTEEGESDSEVTILENQEVERLETQEVREKSEQLAERQREVQRVNREKKILQAVWILLNRNLKDLMMMKSLMQQQTEREMTTAIKQVNTKTHQIRDRLTEAQTAARDQLTELTVQAAAAAKNLEAAIATADDVLRVAEMCQKLKTEQEETSDQHRAERTDAPEPEKGALLFPELRQVTRLLNTSVLQREALDRHKVELSRENQQLRLLLRQCLEAMTVTDDALDERHALLAVRQAPTAVGPPDTSRRHTVIEAVHVVQHSLQD